jgi:hypothetical protein
MGEDREFVGRGGLTRKGNVLFGADRQVIQWVTDRVPGFTALPGAVGLAVMSGSRAAAGVVFDEYNGVHVACAIAVEPSLTWATPRTLRTLFGYPFETLGCLAVTVAVASTNLPSLNLATGLGFRPVAMVRFAAHDGSALVVCQMTRQECRWLYGQEGRQRTESA